MGGTESTTGVTSADGTTVAWHAVGDGPALILVEAAGHFRGFSSFTALTPLLADRFTVYEYDRRGRGASGDTPPYAVAREIEDLDALIALAGGSAHVFGFSSGALLALHAAAAGLSISGLAVLEPPLNDDPLDGPSEFTTTLEHLVASGRHGEAVEYFNAGIGVPPEILDGMRDSPAWSAMESVAPTLVYDSILGDQSPPALLRR